MLCSAIGFAGMCLPVWDAIADDREKKAPVAQNAADPAGDGGGAAEAGSLPMTKTVVSSEDIEDKQDGYAEAVKNVAGVTSNNARGTANDSIKIRGIQLNLFNSYRLNGGLPTAGVISSPTENKERVEVLKGANALMFGIASPGGIVNLVTKRAGDKDVATATTSGNSFGQYGAAVDLGRRFGEDKQVGLRANASATHYENGVGGASGNGKFVSLAADWQVYRDLSLKFDYEHYTRDVAEQALINVLKPVNGVIQVPRVPDPTRLLSGTWALYSPRTDNYQLRADYKLAKNWNLMAEAGQSRSYRSRFTTRIGNYNLDTGLGTATTNIVRDQRYVNKFYRTEIDGRFSTGIFKHDVTVGISSSERDANQPSTVSVVTGQQSIYNPTPLPAPRIPTAPLTYTPQRSSDIGVYVYDAVQLHRQWKLLVGLRETFYEATNTNANGSKTTSRSRTRSPAVGLLYDVLPHTTLYASYMKGLEETGSAPIGAVNQYQILPPASATQVEIGLRTSVNGVHGNVALFDISRANAVVDPVSNIFRLDGTNKFQGAEATVSVDINRQWTVNAAGQYLRAEQNPHFNQTLRGLVPENTPKLTGNLTVVHKSPWLQGLTVNAGVAYVGPRFVNALNQAQIPGVALYSAGLGYATRIAGRKAAFQLSVDNLSNKRYWNSVSSGTYGAGMERSLRFNAKVDF
ncbi:TonB-dependent siderophore receptor [Cupriavidus basilensis]|uniref:TonB-dependent siderophore receptor n=1 Tax=Cupriavidus basilensis TaxID=68895 RepID=A0ABT6B4D6_9BURK|nr:TonB-dependent siderophore receptor [Cupriavidus basilensis]MDF3839744.1 TonB-dependent siderophore receptor [Cupriavidus basilensis]